MMNYIQSLPKTSIAMVLGAINTYLVARGYISIDASTMISTILIALGLGVNYNKITPKK